MLNDFPTRYPTKQSCDQIVNLLTDRQHLHPRLSIQEVLEQATRELGCCPQAIARAVEWLKIDASRAMGRLRRSELLQLARSVDRFWRESVAAAQDARR
jgi:hypothetical protein